MTAEVWSPACMDAAELATWRGDGLPYGGTHGDVIPCSDCLPDYAREMRAEGRCNGAPRGTEGEPMLDDREELGRRQVAALRGGENNRQRVLEARPDAVELVPETPCGTCSHALVCARKRALDAIGDVSVRMPELENGLTLTLHAVVECDAYLRAPKAKATTVVAITRKPLTPEHRDAIRRGQERARAAKAGQQG